MDLQKQKLLLDYCITSGDLFAKVNAILKPEYFDPQIRQAVSFIKSYFEKYRALPNPAQVKAETKVIINTAPEFSEQEIHYASDQIEAFCKNKAIEAAILASPDLLSQGNFSQIEKLIRDAIMVGLHSNLGVDYFLDPQDRINKTELAFKPLSTGWMEVDDALNGGILRQELTIFAASSGVGKSLIMSNLARNLVLQRYNGIYITLELSELVVAKRFDSMFSGIGQIDIFKHAEEVATSVEVHGVKSGKLLIKRMPETTTNMNTIRSYLKECQMVTGIIPDFIVIDYLDIMAANDSSISVENAFIKDKQVTEEIRACGAEYNCAMITASQLNRSSHELSIHEQGHGQIAGGIAKINTADNVLALYQDDKMKALKEYLIKFFKTRSSGGVGQYVKLLINPVSLIISDAIPQNKKLELKLKNNDEHKLKPKKSLIDIMDV